MDMRAAREGMETTAETPCDVLSAFRDRKTPKSEAIRIANEYGPRIQAAQGMKAAGTRPPQSSAHAGVGRNNMMAAAATVTIGTLVCDESGTRLPNLGLGFPMVQGEKTKPI
jgi:hypothetical protein